MPDHESGNSDDNPTSADPGGEEPTGQAETSDQESATSGCGSPPAARVWSAVAGKRSADIPRQASVFWPWRSPR